VKKFSHLVMQCYHSSFVCRQRLACAWRHLPEAKVKAVTWGPPVKDTQHFPERDLGNELWRRKKASLAQEGVELVEHR